MEFSSNSIQGGLFEVFEHVPSVIHVIVPSKACFKLLMKHKGKEVCEPYQHIYVH